ncbi:DUF4112 domain-containing protein [Motiliproteus sp. SC1-56]|uniref:DUF4112 domain-containing protein n=1 Tax=Motiliproteus sp. SC1-56 TaxID=2799565 RepID=UPI001A8F39BD|nr:DUF4112 domain-containing protein [Motiliproteus sp. SC1-56]
MDNPQNQHTRRRLRHLAWLLDSSIRLPGGFRIGLDGLIGLVPGIGDLLTAGLSSYIIAEAARMGVPKSVLARMGFNVLLEVVVGAIPLFGDLFDFVFKANERNLRLIEGHQLSPRRTRNQSRWLMAGVIAGAVALLALLFYLIISLFDWVLTRLAG